MHETLITSLSGVEEKISNYPDDRYFVTGSLREPNRIYHSVPTPQEDNCMSLNIDGTARYGVDAFAGDGMDALANAHFPFWSTIVVPEEYLSEEALNFVLDE